MRRTFVRILYRVLRLIAWPILRVAFGLRVDGRAHLPREGAFILACNHISFLDPAVVGVACPRSLVFLARADLFPVPWLGAFMRLMGAIAVDRHRMDVGLRQAVRELRRGRPVVIFPQGGRQRRGAGGTAKPGVGFLAAHAQAPVIPVLLEGTAEALPPGARWLHRAKIRVAFGPQIRYPTERFSQDAYHRLAEAVTASWRELATTQ